MDFVWDCLVLFGVFVWVFLFVLGFGWGFFVYCFVLVLISSVLKNIPQCRLEFALQHSLLLPEEKQSLIQKFLLRNTSKNEKKRGTNHSFQNLCWENLIASSPREGTKEATSLFLGPQKWARVLWCGKNQEQKDKDCLRQYWALPPDSHLDPESSYRHSGLCWMHCSHATNLSIASRCAGKGNCVQHTFALAILIIQVT